MKINVERKWPLKNNQNQHRMKYLLVQKKSILIQNEIPGRSKLININIPRRSQIMKINTERNWLLKNIQN